MTTHRFPQVVALVRLVRSVVVAAAPGLLALAEPNVSGALSGTAVAAIVLPGTVITSLVVLDVNLLIDFGPFFPLGGGEALGEEAAVVHGRLQNGGQEISLLRGPGRGLEPARLGFLLPARLGSGAHQWLVLGCAVTRAIVRSSVSRLVGQEPLLYLGRFVQVVGLVLWPQLDGSLGG